MSKGRELAFYCVYETPYKTLITYKWQKGAKGQKIQAAVRLDLIQGTVCLSHVPRFLSALTKNLWPRNISSSGVFINGLIAILEFHFYLYQKNHDISSGPLEKPIEKSDTQRQLTHF